MSVLTRDMTTLASAVGNLGGLAVTPDGGLLFASSNIAGRIVGYNLTPGAVTPLTPNYFGTGTAGTADGPGGTATVTNPQAASTDGVYVWFYQPSTFTWRRATIAPAVVDRVITTVAGSGVTGSVDGTGTAASIASVSGSYFHLPSRTIWFSEGLKIRTFNVDTNAVATVGVTTEGASSALCVSRDGKTLYGWFLNRGKLWRMPTSGGFVTYFAGNGSNGTDTDGTGPLAGIRDAIQMDMDSDLNLLYIAQSTGARIRQVDLNTGAVTTVAGNGTYGTSTNGNGTSATINRSNGLRIWPGKAATTLIVTDYNGAALRQIT